MTTIGDILGDKAVGLCQSSISVGDVHLLELGKKEGITPKDRNLTRDKYFIVLGFDCNGNILGGVVINSNINYKLPTEVTDYLLPITCRQAPFLRYDSFVNCSNFITVEKEKFNKDTYRGEITDKSIITLIVNTIKESPTANKMRLREFGL